MTCLEREENLQIYALDALDGAERLELEQHLSAGCPRCAGVLAEARATAAHLALAAPPVQPSPMVKARLLREIAREAKEGTPKPAPSRGWMAPVLAAAAAAAATFLLVGLPASRERTALRDQVAQANARADQAESRANQAEAAYDRAARTLKLLRAPGLEMASLAGQEASPDAHGRLLRDPASGDWQLHVSQLPPTAPGRTYEVWLITADGRPLPAGTFDVAEGGEAELTLTPPQGVAVATVAITDEPDGGVPAPTGKVHLMGSAGS